MIVINLPNILYLLPLFSVLLIFIRKVYSEKTKRKNIDVEFEKFKLSKEIELKINKQNNKAAIRKVEINARTDQRRIGRAS
jgi:hypothetical protein